MKTLAAIAAHIGAELNHSSYSNIEITRVSALGNAGPDSLVFVEKPAGLEAAINSGAGAIIAPPMEGQEDPVLLISNQPRLAFSRAARFLNAETRTAFIHPTAVIRNQEHLGINISVGSNSTIECSLIGDNTSIGAGCCIAFDVVIGDDCTLHPNVTIYPGTTLGDRVIVHAGAVLGADGFGYVRDPATSEYLQFPQQGTLVIEDDVEIGANTTIDRGALEETRIGSGTKIDNLVHIGHNVRIGSNVVIAAQTGISGSCVIEDGAIIGGQVGMGDHATIGAGVIIGSGAGILPHKHVRGSGEVFWGVPAKPLKQHLKELATLAKLTKAAGK